MDLTKLYNFIEAEGKIQLSEDFKKTLEQTFSVALSEKEAEIETMKASSTALETEVSSLKDQVSKLQEGVMEDVNKAVEEYKESLVEKISSYLDVELERMIPEDVAEKVAKAEIYEPLVEGFKATIARYGVEFESEGHSLLKEAKEEIMKLRTEVDGLTKNNIKLTTEAAKTTAVMTLVEKMEGLTDEQKKKIVVIFKGKSADEINERFDEVRDLIIGMKEEQKKEETKEIVAEEKKTVVAEEVKTTQAEVIKEEVEDLGQRLL